MEMKLYIFDFDDTLIKSDSRVIIKKPSGQEQRLTSSEFAIHQQVEGDEYDFSQFDLYPLSPTIIEPVFDMMQKLIENFSYADVVVITARADKEPVEMFLKDAGIHHVNVYAVGSDKVEAKSDLLKKILPTKNYSGVHVFEDNPKYISTMKQVCRECEVPFSYSLVRHPRNTPGKNLHKSLKNITRGVLDKLETLVARKHKPISAGTILVRFFNGKPKVLGLIQDGKIDLPKGKQDPGESILQTALRETKEECDIDSFTFSWGVFPIVVGNCTFFLAQTNQDAQVIANPKSGMYEHENAVWLEWNNAISGTQDYLKPALKIAKKIIEKSRNVSRL